MASSGMRLGGFVGLRDGDIRPIFDEANKQKTSCSRCSRLQREQTMKDDTFISPEAFSIYQEYRNLRIKFGEVITKKSPITFKGI